MIGNLLTGNIDSGSLLILPTESGEHSVRINSVEYIDHLRTQCAELGLMVRLENEQTFDVINKLVGTTVRILIADDVEGSYIS